MCKEGKIAVKSWGKRDSRIWNDKKRIEPLELNEPGWRRP